MSKGTTAFYINISPIPKSIFSKGFGTGANIQWQWEVRGIDTTEENAMTQVLAHGQSDTKTNAQIAAEAWADALGDGVSYFYHPKN